MCDRAPETSRRSALPGQYLDNGEGAKRIYVPCARSSKVAPSFTLNVSASITTP